MPSSPIDPQARRLWLVALARGVGGVLVALSPAPPAGRCRPIEAAAKAARRPKSRPKKPHLSACRRPRPSPCRRSPRRRSRRCRRRRREAKPPGVPIRRARYDSAILEALDKVTAESLRFEAPVGRPVRYKSLVFTVKACERSAPDEPVEDSIAYMTVDSQPQPEPGRPALPPRQAFKGWMYASSPSLHVLEHPVYDAWLITCRAAAPPNPVPSPPPAPAR